MPKQIQITLSPKEAAALEILHQTVARQSKLSAADIAHIRILRRSIDARKRQVKVVLTIELLMQGEQVPVEKYHFRFENVSSKPEVIIAGAGPAGLFAAFKLIELGLKPVIIERGKKVSNRKIDIAALCRGNGLNPESNYCFGEGGAGTFSDGKLYTRSRKRGDIERVLQLFHTHGASEEILFESHPHIGTDILPTVIKNMRNTIIQCGGEFHFEQRLTGFMMRQGRVYGIHTTHSEKYEGKAVILATGHSAGDVYEMFYENKYLLETKPFAMGVRIEHPQKLINEISYHRSPESEYLPVAAYNLVTQIDQRGVYSFCMCPGGYIVPASTVEDQQVVNGMSSSKRHTAFASSGIVVETRLEDLAEYKSQGVLAGLRYQQYLEQLASKHGGGNQIAPAQRTADFVNGHFSSSLPACSYLPQVISSPLHSWLPQPITQRLQEAFKIYERKMRGFLTSESLVVGVESRSSSPVRIPRDPVTWEHVQLKGLFPCGEGSGYAGGITSSAIDGEKAAEYAYRSFMT